MRAVERAVYEVDYNALTYRQLAEAVYATASPTRAHLSAVARAVARLETVEVWRDAFDGRTRFVGQCPAVPDKVLEFVDRAPYGAAYEELAQSMYRTTMPTPGQLRSVVTACNILVSDGRARLARPTWRGEPRVISVKATHPPGRSGPFRDWLDEHMSAGG